MREWGISVVTVCNSIIRVLNWQYTGFLVVVPAALHHAQ